MDELDQKRTTRVPKLLAHRVQVAIEARQLYAAYQPIVELRRNTVFAHEALARSDIAELSSPLQLLQAAAAEQVLGRLGRELRRVAVARNPGTPLFLNVHPDEFDEPYLTMTDDPMFSIEDVYLEITESAPLTRYRFSRDVLAELRRRGIKLVLDDFGAGYSNVMYLAELGPDAVKIDHSVIAGIRCGTRQHALLRSIARMCDDQGARAIAEGIETEAELEAVREAGIDLGQGYLLGKPMRL